MSTAATMQENPMNNATIEVTNVSNFADKTMFLSLEFERYGNSRKAEVQVVTDGKQDRFASSKRLLNSPELAAIHKADNALKQWIDAPHRCWKYGRSGLRICPMDIVLSVREQCLQYQKVDRPKLVAAAKAVYLDQIKQAEIDLGKDFRASDYATLEEFESEFSFVFKFFSFDTPEKLKMISPQLFEEEKAKNEETMKSFAEEMTAGMRLYFHSAVSNLLDALKPDSDGKQKKLQPRTVEKLQEYFSTFDFKNIANDAELKAEVDKIKLVMSGIDAEKIRNNEGLQADLAKQLEEVKNSMSAVVETKGRKIR